MALYHGEYDSSEHSIFSTPASSVYSEDEEESLLASYRTVTSEFKFTGAMAFQKCCNDRERNFADGFSSCNEYILFTGVSRQDLKIVDTVRKSVPKMCCLYDVREEVLIVKLMVGVGHEASSIALLLIFTDKLKDLKLREEIRCLGSARFGEGMRQKEADQSFKPIRTRPAADNWPSLTFEVGFSESLTQLRNDARFWLTRSPLDEGSMPTRQTKIVLVIHIDKTQRQIQIERWEVVSSPRPRLGSVDYPPTVEWTQQIVLREGDQYTGEPLTLSVDKVFDKVPENLEDGALDFTVAELQTFNDSFWRDFP